jgi:hypothetical protein
MHIYLRHPKHGTKVASLLSEAKEDEENGWEEFDPYEVVKLSVEPEIEEPIEETPVKTKKEKPSFLE